MEDVRMLVQEEGRAARNLVAFHVDVASPSAGKIVNRKPPSSPRLLNEARMTKRSSLVAKTGSRVRSASTGRDKKSELQARYWAFLFGNLQRAVDEIYQTCETDESVSECKEVILVLENFTRDFHNLIEWFRLKWEYENTPPPQRPTSLAWEVRKSSPGKVMSTSRIDRSDKQSPVKKQLNFFSDVKLSSAEECPKKAFTLENELSNKYGLSFGDLEEHLQYVDTITEVPNNDNQDQVILPATKPETGVEENNKENLPNLIRVVDERCKPLMEVASSNQSSQTDEIALQSSKVPLKSIPTASGSTPKKPQATVKSAFGSVVKTSTLSPLSVNKTVPSVSSRKTVPVSPTSTVPPRIIPGRNVAAVTFVPSKKLVPTSQSKINTNLNRGTNNMSKTSNIPPQSSEKGVNERLKNSVAMDTNKLVEQEKVDLTKEPNDNCLTDGKVPLNQKVDGIVNHDLKNVNNSSLIKVNTDKTEISVLSTNNNKAEKPIGNGTVVLGGIKSSVIQESLNQKTPINQSNDKNITNLGDKTNDHIVNVKEKQNEAQINVSTVKVSHLKNNNLQEEPEAMRDNKQVKNLDDKSNSLGGNLKDVNSVKAVKPMKLDKSIQTDLSHLAQIAAAKQTAKVTSLVRNKTAPIFTRKSNEMLAPCEPTLETSKTVKNTAVNQPRTLAPALKKQTSVPEASNEKTAHDKQVIEKLTIEKATSTKMAFPPLKKTLNAPETNGEKIENEKQAIEKFSNEKPTVAKVITIKHGFPPLTNQTSVPETNSEKLSKEKQMSEKPSNEKSVRDKATSPKPAYATVSVYRSNTAIELRSRPSVHHKACITAVKPAGSEKQARKHNIEKISDEKQASAKPSSEKLRNEKTTTVKPANVASAPKVYRSSTSIELRPRVSFNRSVDSATVKAESHESQLSKIRGTNPGVRNPSLMKKSKPLFKSEQNLQKKNSIDEDGWETVKGRNRWKLSQSSGTIKGRTPNSRFHQPSPATSLPALALASESPVPDPKPAKLHKDRQNQEIAKANRVALRNKSQMTKHISKSEPESVSNSGKKGKKEDEIEIENKLSDRKKISNGKGNVKKTLNGVKQEDNNSKIDKLMDILSSEDEKMNEEEIRKSRELYEKEKKLTKEIQDLEKSEIEIDTETDDAETDGETNVENEEDDTNCRINALKASYEDVCSQLSWADQMDTLEKLEKLMANDTSTKGIPWDERLSTLEQLEELVARHPGRALELHQKLSSPSRRRHLPDTIQRHRERQESAQLKREQLLQDKTNKMRELLNKVEEVQKQQAQLKEVRRSRIAEKLKRAEENRALHIRSIQRKAHDEDEKMREIMFINELEAQNKRHDFIASCQEKEGRLQGIHDERQRKQEEKAAKEAAVEERRRIIEAERQERLEQMQEKRRKREERIGREQQEKEKERQELAREKQRDHEKRLQALQAMHQANTEELQKKIQQKQVDSARRHEENIEHIRQRALESGALRGAADDEAPCLTPYDTYKLCTKCNILIESEVYLLSHLRGKGHQEAVKDLKDDSEPVIIDAPPDKMDAKLAQDRERQKALRKRCKKIRSRMAQRGEEYLSKLSSEGGKKLDSPNKMRLFKCLRNVDKLHSSQGLGQWPDNAVTLLERNLAEINRILDKQNELDQKVFQDLNGFSTLSNILNLGLDIPKNMSPYLPPKCFLTSCMVYSLACSHHPGNSRFVVFSNKISLVLDLLLNRLNTLITDDYRTSNKSSTNLPVDPVAGALMKLFALILSHSQENVPDDVPDMAPRLQDIISYTVSVGVVDKLALYCSSVRDPIDDNPLAAQFLLNAIQLLTTLAQTKCALVKGDPTQLVATLRVTELVGGVSMLYGMLLHQGVPPSSPPSLPLHTVCVTQATLQLLKAVAQLDLNMFQSVLGAEGISLQLRHIASYLLWYCSHPGSGDNGVSSDIWLEDKRELLHQVIEVVGYFAVNHYDNQMMLQSGHMPTVLQQLCNLPFGYFSDPSLSCHLLPSLLACCHANQENKTILEQELNYQLLEDFRNSEAARSNPLVQLIK